MNSTSPQTNFLNPNKNVTAVEPSLATKVFASALFSGYSPFASGTVGSAVALAIYCIPGFESPLIIGITTLVVCILGIPAAEAMEKWYGHDPAEVTIDEVVGMWISLFLLPKKIYVALAAFVLFRLLDIIKPPVSRRFDSMHGGIGIMMDDVIAGVYANVILELALMIPVIKGLLLR
ncbi:MAG: phosphatidylglycerophosphatase A [Ignavibacteriales bacterium]|nr:phosphatidylglycerophosphatase A [Ignavibacteriales bacterium]